MKVSIAFERASHVNSGTSVDPWELAWPQTEGRVMRHPLLHLESDSRGEITHYGGLVLAQQFVRRFRVAQWLDESLTLFKRHFRNAIVRGDTDFDRSDVFNAAIDGGAYFAIGGRLYPNRAALVEAIAEESWKPFVPRADRQEPSGPSRHVRTANYRQKKAKERKFRTLRTVKQWVSEIAYPPAGFDSPCRMIVRRILIEENNGQGALFEHFRYRLVLTDLPRSYTAGQVVDITYQRCDQENVIEQFGHGIAGWHMPVAEFMGNSAWLQIARLAWNLGKWIAQVALPSEVVRWEWKRFRRH